MKYYVMYISNGSLQLDKTTEWTDLNQAIAAYHGVCKTLRTNAGVKTAYVAILDNNQLNVVDDYGEFIDRRSEYPVES